ncbi:MAG: hypothetical protein P4L67_04040 [Candidatus Pacebacteria bacterium]|nr:hypothetical protein [Candidatus Paceibacterota bacterium]
MLPAFEKEESTAITNGYVETMDSLMGILGYGDSKGFVYFNQLEFMDHKLSIDYVDNKKVFPRRRPIPYRCQNTR